MVLGSYPLPLSLFLVFLLWFVQPIQRRIGFALTRAELALLFCLLFATTRFWSSSYSVLPLSLGVAAFYYANPVNNYELLHPHIPRWLVPQDKLVVKAFYEGSPDGKVPWQDWLPALSAWTLSTVLLWVCLFGLTLLFRRQWIDVEKMVFPVAQVPLAMMDEQKAVWNSKPFWLGFLFPFLLHCWNGLAFISLFSLPSTFTPSTSHPFSPSRLGSLSLTRGRPSVFTLLSSVSLI